MKNEAKVVNCSGLMTKLLITMPLLPPPASSLSARLPLTAAAAVVSFRLAIGIHTMYYVQYSIYCSSLAGLQASRLISANDLSVHAIMQEHSRSLPVAAFCILIVVHTMYVCTIYISVNRTTTYYNNHVFFAAPSYGCYIATPALHCTSPRNAAAPLPEQLHRINCLLHGIHTYVRT